MASVEQLRAAREHLAEVRQLLVAALTNSQDGVVSKSLASYLITVLDLDEKLDTLIPLLRSKQR